MPTSQHTDSGSFGTKLAERVADFLASGNEIAGYHRDDCGLGMRCSGGRFYYCHFYDGMADDPSGPTHDKYLDFPDRAAFVSWLAEQSEATVTIDHEPLTKGRLERILTARTDSPGEPRV